MPGVRGTKANRIERWQRVESEVKDFMRVESSEDVLDVKIGGRVESVYQKSTWKEKMIGRKALMCSH